MSGFKYSESDEEEQKLYGTFHLTNVVYIGRAEVCRLMLVNMPHLNHTSN